MKNKLIFLSIFLLSFDFVFYSSCKKDKNDAAKFIGTWMGTSTCGKWGGVIFIAGNSESSLKTEYTLGGVCVSTIDVTVNGTVNGNNIAFLPQTFTDSCGEKITVSSSGSLSGNTLEYTFVIAVSGSIVYADTCSIIATKQ